MKARTSLVCLFCLAIGAGCEADADKLARLRGEAETECQGLQHMRNEFDSAFGYWMRMNPDTLVPVMAAYGDSLKYWYDRCEVAVRSHNTFRQEIGDTSAALRIPDAP